MSSLTVFGIGAVIGSMLGAGVTDTLAVGAGLAAPWILMACVALLVSKRNDRFDIFVQDTIDLRRSARRSRNIGAALTLLALIASASSLFNLSEAGEIGHLVGMAIVAIIAVVIIFNPWLTPAREHIDWAETNLCRRCGYDRTEGVSTCPECGEEATTA